MHVQIFEKVCNRPIIFDKTVSNRTGYLVLKVFMLKFYTYIYSLIQ